MYHDLLIKEDKTSAVIGRQLHVFCMDYIFSTRKKNSCMCLEPAWAGSHAQTLAASACKSQRRGRGCRLLHSSLNANVDIHDAGGLSLCCSPRQEKSKPSSPSSFACGFVKVLMPPAGEIPSDTHLPVVSLPLPHALPSA